MAIVELGRTEQLLLFKFFRALNSKSEISEMRISE
jgi:hypothetical protein